MDNKALDKNRRDFLKGSLAIGASGMLMGILASFATFLSRPAEAASEGQSDPVGETDDLIGFIVEYSYPSGPHYILSFKSGIVDFRSPWPGEKREPPKGPEGDIYYKARKIKEGIYLVHWIVNWQAHIALLFDFEEKRTICAALMGKTELWDVGYWDRWIVPPSLKKYEMKV
jgi:hypothetical protein